MYVLRLLCRVSTEARFALSITCTVLADGHRNCENGIFGYASSVARSGPNHSLHNRDTMNTKHRAFEEQSDCGRGKTATPLTEQSRQLCHTPGLRTRHSPHPTSVLPSSFAKIPFLHCPVHSTQYPVSCQLHSLQRHALATTHTTLLVHPFLHVRKTRPEEVGEEKRRTVQVFDELHQTISRPQSLNRIGIDELTSGVCTDNISGYLPGTSHA